MPSRISNQINSLYSGVKNNTNTASVSQEIRKKYTNDIIANIAYNKDKNGTNKVEDKTENIMESTKKKPLYIDSLTQEAFKEAGSGNYITQEELASLWQIFRSANGTEIFTHITKMNISWKNDMKILFTLAKNGEINLSEIIKNNQLAKYTTRTSQFAFD